MLRSNRGPLQPKTQDPLIDLRPTTKVAGIFISARLDSTAIWETGDWARGYCTIFEISLRKFFFAGLLTQLCGSLALIVTIKLSASFSILWTK